MIKFKIFLLLIFIFLPKNSWASFSLIRDAESEKMLRELTYPIFKAANLNSENIKIYIVNDDSINAFVAGGQNVFINTGLIRKFKTPDALIGVIAHEAGHIAGGHLARSSEGMEAANNAMLLSYLLGIGAVASGSPDAGMALIIGGSQTAQRLQMRFTRTQEEAADQYAIEYLTKMRYPASGLVQLLEIFERDMIGYKGAIDEYLLSHPISRKRIDVIKNRAQNFVNSSSHQKINRELQPSFNLVLGKLEGFLENPDSTLEKYKNKNSPEENYAKSIAFFRKGKIDESLQLLDSLINNNPKNGFFYEMKGQVLFESGKAEDAVIIYNQALKKLDYKDSSLAKISFASAILSINTNDKDLNLLAIKKLEEAKNFEPQNAFLFKQLAAAYNKIGDESRSLLALSEFNFLSDNKEKCQKYAKEAKEKLDKKYKREIIHADDLLESCKEKDEDKKKE